MKKLTHEEFLKRLKEKNEHYRNGEFEVVGEYQPLGEPILIKNKYGICSIRTYTLYEGHNPTINSSLDKTSYIINQYKEVYGDVYDYANFEFKGYNKKGIIICRIHGEFKVAAGSHLLSKSGCPKCGRERGSKKKSSNTDTFIKQAIEVHGDRYDYSKVKYVRALSKVEILCREHGSFWQKPNSHVSSENGCPACKGETGYYTKESWAKLKVKKESILYLIQVYDNQELFLKVGITKNTISSRFKGTKNMPYKYKLISEVKSYDRGLLWDKEKEINTIFKDCKYKPNKKFGGYSECFNINSLKEINEKFKEINKIKSS